MKSKGSRAFDALPGSVQQKADRYNDGKTAAVYAWIAGRYQPSREKQIRMQALDAIEREWWDEPAPDAPGAVPSGAPRTARAGDATPAAVAGEADKLLADIRDLGDVVRAIVGGDPAEKIRNLERLTTMAVALQKMRGVLMSERQILESPHWLSLWEKVMKALEPWPDALRAVGEALAPPTLDG